MNILQVQNTLKDLSDGQLQKQMLNPDGSAPSFLVLSELQRRKDLRAGYAEHQASGKSMAEEYAKGVGGANVGQYSPAMRAATNPGMSPEMDANPDQPMQGESPMQTQGPPAPAPQGYAGGGVVKLADGGFLDFLLPNFQKGMQLGQQPSPSMTMGTGRRYLGPGTPSPRGIENLYFDYGPQPGPGAPGAPPPSTPMGVQAAMSPQMYGGMIDGSANGATGAAGAGSVGAAVGEGASVSGGDAGTVGASVGGNAGTAASADAGDGDGSGTYWRGGGVGRYAGGGGVMPYMDEENADRNVQDVPDSYVRDTRTMKQKFDDAMRVPSKDMGSAAVRGIASSLQSAPWQEWYDKNQRMVDTERQMDDRFWTPAPGRSLGQTMAERLQGRQPDTNVGEDTNPFSPPGGRGMDMPDPSDPSAVYGDPNEATGVPNNVGQNQTAGPGGPGAGGPLQPGSEGSPGVVPGGGLPSGPGGRRPGINVGGAGLQDYYDQVRAMSPPDGFAEIAKRNQEDRDELKKMRKDNAGMAMLAAGLGIAGGDSPYFATNVGKGGMAGVKAWQEGDKEVRQASRDIRNAENQITIAKANRDERQLEKATTLYARGQENEQRGLDRQANAQIRAADRAEALRLKEMEIKETSADRKERLEESRITHLGSMAQKSEHDASIAETKLAALNKPADPMETPADKLAREGRIAEAQAGLDTARRQGEYQRQRYTDAVNDREISKGRLTKVTSGDHMRELKKQGKLKSGDKIIRPDGQLGTVD